LTNDRIELMAGIRDTLTNNTGLIQVYPVALTTEGREGPAEAKVILEVLAPRIPGTFERSITELTFGGISASEPFIVITATTFDAAFAGMLAWEATMSSDLAPLFGEPVGGTISPDARTVGGVTVPTFSDSIIANRSARVLVDEQGLERLVYTFINQETILITTSRTATERLVPRVR
jgi:hypothetical protein